MKSQLEFLRLNVCNVHVDVFGVFVFTPVLKVSVFFVIGRPDLSR